MGQTKSISFPIDDTGDEDLEQTNRAQPFAFDGYPNGHDSPPLHPISQFDVRQLRPLQPFLSEGVVAPAYPLPTGTGSDPIYTYDAATCYQPSCVCACHFQDPYNLSNGTIN